MEQGRRRTATGTEEAASKLNPALATDSQRRRSRISIGTRLKSSHSIGTRGSVMRTIDIDHKDYQAIRREIGERLRLELGIELELPACLKGKLDELCGLEGKSSSVVPDVELGFKNKAK